MAVQVRQGTRLQSLSLLGKYDMKMSRIHFKRDAGFLTTNFIAYMLIDEDQKVNHMWNGALNSPCLLLTIETILLLLFKFCQMPLSLSVSPLTNLFSRSNYQICNTPLSKLGNIAWDSM